MSSLNCVCFRMNFFLAVECVHVRSIWYFCYASKIDNDQILLLLFFYELLKNLRISFVVTAAQCIHVKKLTI